MVTARVIQGLRRGARGAPSRARQKGFTLIELLVVISILGILAAIVTMSLVGITSLATKRAADAELQSVQIAYDSMLENEGVSEANACPTSASTSNMNTWPASAQPAADGSPSHAVTALNPRYLRQDKTHGTYHCEGSGLVKQDSYTP